MRYYIDNSTPWCTPKLYFDNDLNRCSRTSFLFLQQLPTEVYKMSLTILKQKHLDVHDTSFQHKWLILKTYNNIINCSKQQSFLF